MSSSSDADHPPPPPFRGGFFVPGRRSRTGGRALSSGCSGRRTVATREVKVQLTADVAGFVAAGYADPNAHPGLRSAICDWLRANGIDPALVPADERPDCSYRDGGGTPVGGHTITTRVRIRVSPDTGGLVIRQGANRLEEATITKPMKVAPPLIVQQYLDAKCPTCGR